MIKYDNPIIFRYGTFYVFSYKIILYDFSSILINYIKFFFENKSQIYDEFRYIIVNFVVYAK